MNSSPWADFKGGGQIAVHYLATHLARNNCNVWVVYTGKKKEEIQPLNYNVIFARHFDIKTINLNMFSVAFEVLKLSKKNKLDIIHGNGEEAFFLPILKKLIGSKFFLTSHSPFIPKTGCLRALKSPIQMLKRLNFYLLRKTAINSDYLLTYSDFSNRLVKDGIGENDISIKTIAPGIDPSWFDVEICDKKSSSNLLYFGRIEHEKGIDILIQAFAGLLPEFPSLKLYLVGEGNYLSFCEKLCGELGIKENTVFYGWKEKDDIQKIMSDCTLCVLPSRIESFGLTIVEAMASGIPVISTKVGAVPEIIKDGDAGILVPPNDIDALKKAIYFALKNGIRMREKANIARENVKIFSWDLSAKKHIEIYKSVLYK